MMIYGNENAWSTESVLRVTVLFASLGALVSSLEYLKLLPHFCDRGLFSARLFGTHLIPRWAGVLVRFVPPPCGAALVLAIRTLAAAWCLLFPCRVLIVPLTLMV